MIDFTNCKIDITATYGGSDQKRGIIFNNKRYMLKYANRILDDNRIDDLNSSYSNSVLSEHICCKIIKRLGYDVQNTLLGTVDLYKTDGYVETKPVVACENFIPNGWELVEFKNIENAVLSNPPGRIPKINDLYEIFNNNNAYFNTDLGEELLYKYWEQFVLDAYMGNFDRHANNWGYLINKETHEIKLAPIYDCGSCLYPQLSDEGIINVLNDDEEIKERVDKFPTAALEIDGKKANYRQFLSETFDYKCLEAIVSVTKNIKNNADLINDTINKMPINNLRKEFYITMLQARLERILLPAYERAIDIIQNRNQDSRFASIKTDCISKKMEQAWHTFFDLPKEERKSIKWGDKTFRIAEFEDMYIAQCKKENVAPNKDISHHFWKNCVSIQGYKPVYCDNKPNISI